MLHSGRYFRSGKFIGGDARSLISFRIEEQRQRHADDKQSQERDDRIEKQRTALDSVEQSGEYRDMPQHRLHPQPDVAHQPCGDRIAERRRQGDCGVAPLP